MVSKDPLVPRVRKVLPELLLVLVGMVLPEEKVNR